MYFKILFIPVFLISFWGFTQNYEKLGKEFCASINKGIPLSQDNLYTEFSKYHNLDNEKSDLLISEFNSFFFNVQKEAIKQCSKDNPFLQSYSFFTLSNIADVEKIFTNEQIKELQVLLKEVQYKKRLQIFLITTDDYFPHQDIDEFSTSIIDNNYNSLFEKGAIAFVINSKERNIKITTSPYARSIISDENCQKILDEIIIPYFKEKKYYEGIKASISHLSSIF